MDKPETVSPTGGRPAVNTLEPYWMPFTGNRHFKNSPRLLAAASGMYYTSDDGRKILDGCAGLWCVNAGHGRAEITEAIRRNVRHVAIMAYTKKNEYGPARVEARNITLDRVGRAAVAQLGNTLAIDGVELAPEDIDIEALYERGYMQK
jgi:4-aminobutyrate aminotransferase-like enzyme